MRINRRTGTEARGVMHPPQKQRNSQLVNLDATVSGRARVPRVPPHCLAEGTRALNSAPLQSFIRFPDSSCRLSMSGKRLQSFLHLDT